MSSSNAITACRWSPGLGLLSYIYRALSSLRPSSPQSASWWRVRRSCQCRPLSNDILISIGRIPDKTLAASIHLKVSPLLRWRDISPESRRQWGVDRLHRTWWWPYTVVALPRAGGGRAWTPWSQFPMSWGRPCSHAQRRYVMILRTCHLAIADKEFAWTWRACFRGRAI